jgi:hypothetical protein
MPREERQTSMSEPVVFNLSGKIYQVPMEMVVQVPKLHANFVQIGLTNEEFIFTFGNKLDTLTGDMESKTVIPQVVVYMTIPQAQSFAQSMQGAMVKLNEAIQMVQAEVAKAEAAKANAER